MILLKLLYFLLIIPASPVNSQNTLSLDEVRDKYFNNNDRTCYVLVLLDAFSTKSPEDPVMTAYYGAASAAAPGCAGSPAEKLSLFRKGKALLREAVKQSPGDYEIRFLRFATQVKAPKFLMYNGKINEDKEFLISNLEAGKNQFKGSQHFKTVLRFLLDSGKLDQTEKQTVKSYL